MRICNLTWIFSPNLCTDRYSSKSEGLAIGARKFFPSPLEQGGNGNSTALNSETFGFRWISICILSFSQNHCTILRMYYVRRRFTYVISWRNVSNELVHIYFVRIGIETVKKSSFELTFISDHIIFAFSITVGFQFNHMKTGSPLLSTNVGESSSSSKGSLTRGIPSLEACKRIRFYFIFTSYQDNNDKTDKLMLSFTM